MWPFQGNKNKATTSTTTATLEKYFEHSTEDDQLRISPARVKSLKKTLFYESSAYCEEQDFDIFTVCWDVSRLAEPPDDIAPLLPPTSWGEPDIICIGLQNCAEEAAASWSVVFSQSVSLYSSAYAPLSSEAPYEPIAGTLLLVFMRSELHHLVHAYAHEDRGVAAVRFGFHHSSVCIVTVPNLEPVETADPGLSPSELALRKLCEVALRRQKFRNLVEAISFNGSSLTLDNHPFIIWLGTKDEKLRHEGEIERIAFDFLNKGITQRARSQRHYDFKPSCEPLPRLINHMIDVRFRKRSFVPFDAAALPFVTEGSAITQPNRGRVAVLKAGTMRLVLELVDEEGLPVPCESSSELVLLRMSIPIVDVSKLKALYQSTWRQLQRAPPDEYPSVAVNRSAVQLKGPIRPWEPTLFKFNIKNICKYNLPASFSLYCVSDSGSYVIPLTKHSFHYATHGAPPREPVVAPKPPSHTARPNDAAKSLATTTQLKSLSSKLSSKSLLVGSMTSRSVGGFGTNFLSRVLGGSKRKSGAKTARPELQPSLGSDTPRGASSEELIRSSSPQTSMQAATALSTPRNYGSTSASSPLATPRKIAPSFSLTKWVAANPMEGVAVAGKEAEVVVSIMLMEGVSTHCQCEPLTLVVRLDDCKRDVFVSIDPQIRPSLFGLSATDLIQLGKDPLIAIADCKSESYRTPAKWLEENAAASGDSAAAAGSLPLPKELWNLLKFVHQALLRSVDPRHQNLPASWQDSQLPAKWFCLPVMLKDAAFSWTKAHPLVRAEMAVIVKSLETNHQIPASCSIEAALRVLEKWLLAAPLSFVPRESLVNAEQDDGDMHIVCRAILLNLSTVSRNILMAIFSVMRELLIYTAATHDAMIPMIDLNDFERLHCSDLLPAHATLASVMSRSSREELVNDLLDSQKRYRATVAPELTHTLAEWLGRIIAEESPRELRNFFVRHFLQ